MRKTLGSAPGGLAMYWQGWETLFSTFMNNQDFRDILLFDNALSPTDEMLQRHGIFVQNLL